jgi:predicted component of type VI protein secretion system
MSVFAFASEEVDVYAVADVMQQRGWYVDRQQRPPSLHMMITPAHAELVEEIVGDLRAAVATVKNGAPSEGAAAMYGMLGKMPDRSAVEDFVLDMMDQW